MPSVRTAVPPIPGLALAGYRYRRSGRPGETALAAKQRSVVPGAVGHPFPASRHARS